MRFLFRLSLFITAVIILIPIHPVNADERPQDPIIGNDTCLECHSDPNLYMPLEDGAQLSLFIDQEVFDSSIHGELRYACVQCHTTLGEYPHPEWAGRRGDSLSKLEWL